MDFVKVQEAIGVCETMIRKAFTYPSSALLDVEQKKKLEHCLDMIVQMRDWPAERLDKSFRWLGYIQGMIHAFDVADLDELKNMSRPTEADEKREADAKAAETPSYEDPLPKLKVELQRRLDDENLVNVSTEEMNELGELARRIEVMESNRLQLKAGLVELRDAAGKILPAVLPGLIRWANGAVDLRANVLAFHRGVIEVEPPAKPCVPEEKIVRRRMRLIAEEFFEVLKSVFPEAKHDPLDHYEEYTMRYIAETPIDVNLPNLMKELADLAYVGEGGFLDFGVDSRPVHTAVHQTNMTKKGGPVREDGKTGRPEGWVPPDMAGIIEAQERSE